MTASQSSKVVKPLNVLRHAQILFESEIKRQNEQEQIYALALVI